MPDYLLDNHKYLKLSGDEFYEKKWFNKRGIKLFCEVCIFSHRIFIIGRFLALIKSHMNMFLRECAEKNMKPNIHWQ